MKRIKLITLITLIIMSVILPNKIIHGVPGTAEAKNSVARFVDVNTISDSNNVFIDDDGKMSIGTSIVSNEKLTVSGNIISAGIEWTLRTQSTNNGWRCITYGNGLFVALSYTGTGDRIMTSPDGINWTTRVSTADNWWKSVVYGNGLFVAVSDTGTGNRIATSPDGITWTSRSNPEDNSWTGVAYGNGTFVAVSSDGTNRVMTSYDGITWVSRSGVPANQWQAITYGNGLFVAIANSGTNNRIVTSPDGITWTQRNITDAQDWRSICYGNGRFVAVNISGSNKRVVTSTDGVTWTIRTTPPEANNYWRGVTYGNGLFVAVASLSVGTNDRIMTSSDGITWKIRYCPQNNYWDGVAFGNGIFVAIGRDGTNRVMTSGKMVRNEIPTKNVFQGGIDITGNVTIGDSGKTDYVNISKNGISLNGTAKKWYCVNLKPENIGLPSSNPPLRDEYQGFIFDRYDRSTEEQIFYSWHVPTDFAEGTASIRGHFGLMVENPPSGTGDETIIMGYEYKKITPSDGDVFDFSSGTTTGTVEITIVDGEPAMKFHSSEVGYLNTTGFKKEDVILFRFFRDATNPNDTYDNEAVGADNDAWVNVYHLEYLIDGLGGD